MDKDAVIEKLVTELSLTRIAMGQLICNQARRYESAGLQKVVAEWFIRAPQMQRQQWIAGTDALVHYLRLSQAQSAKEAIGMLRPADGLYDKNAKLYRGIHWLRGNKSDDVYRQGIENLRSEIIPVDVAYQSSKTQFARCDNRSICWYRHSVEACKSMLAGGKAWLRK